MTIDGPRARTSEQTPPNHLRRRADSSTPDVSGRPSATLKGLGPEAWRFAAICRLICIMVVIAVILVVPDIGSTRTAAALAIAAPALLISLTLFLPMKRGRNHGQVIAVTDLGLTFGFILLVPVAFAAGMILVIGLVPLYVHWLGTRRTIGINIVATALFVGFGIATTPTGWIPGVIMFALVVTLLTTAASVITSSSKTASEHRRSLFNGIDALIWESSGPELQRHFTGDRIAHMFGFPAEEWHRVGFFESRIHRSDQARVELTTGGIGSAGVTRIDYRIIDNEGTTRFIQERITSAINANGDVSHRGVVIEDTNRLMTESAARGFDDFISEVPVGMMVLRLENPSDVRSLRIITANPAAAGLFASYDEDPIGSLLVDLVPNDSTTSIPNNWDLPARLADVVINGSDLEDRSLRLPGSNAVYSVRAIALADQSVGLTFDDMTHTARTAEALRRRAMHDDLTGLPNRAQFNERLESAIRSCNSTSDPTNVAVLMVDLNKFKQVNDTYGHEYGDKLLVEVARRLTRNIRGCDTIARLGGDEFAVIVLAEDAHRAARDIAERIEQMVCEPFEILGQTITIGTSVGIAVRSRDLLSARTLLRDADHAMYRAKAKGGGIVSHDGRPTSRGTTVKPR